jgi:nitric oxide reductase NorQ protein
VACHDDLSATDLTGRYLVIGGETVWHDGPLSAAARTGAICYLDELVEARADTIVVIHPLADHRRVLPIEKTGELVAAAPGFQLVISYNPGYQQLLKELKPSTRQRFVAIEFALPVPEAERRIVVHEGGVPEPTAAALVELAIRLRRLDAHGLAELPSTRLLVSTARLLAGGIPAREACRAALVAPLTDDPELRAAMDALVTATF